MTDKDLVITSEISPILQEIKTVLDTARSNVARQVNSELLNTYWNIGRIICEYDHTATGRLRQADLERTFQGVDKGIR